MVSRRSFKTDESFLEKISIGATGTKRVFADLRTQGHNPIELESRAKTSFEISMSHSLSDPERGWDYGLNDNDFVALVACKRIGNKPIDWEADQLVQYISVKELRSAQVNQEIEEVKPKGAQEGFEVRIKWPAVIAKSSGVIKRMTANHIQYQRLSDNRTITLRMRPDLKLLVREGEAVEANQVLAAVVPVTTGFLCTKSASATLYISLLSSLTLSERYTAAKALSFFHSTDVFNALSQKISESDENILVKLEAAAGLALHGREQGWTFIKQCIRDNYLANRLEAVIILGEITTDVSCQILMEVLLDNEQDSEIRAGAAWALGELHNKLALPALIKSFEAMDKGIRVEGARALAKLASSYTLELLKKFPESSIEKRPGIAWALSKAGHFSIEDILNTLVDDDARQWVAYILGNQDQQQYIQDIELLKQHDPEVYFAVTVLWKITSSWVYNLEEF